MNKEQVLKVLNDIRNIEKECLDPNKLHPERVAHAHVQLSSMLSSLDEAVEEIEKSYYMKFTNFLDEQKEKNPRVTMKEVEIRYKAEADSIDRIKVYPKRVERLIDSLKKMQSHNEIEYRNNRR